MIHWALWTIPLAIGFSMFLRDTGLSWERTEKKDQNHALVRRAHGGDAVIDPRERELADSTTLEKGRVVQ